MELIYPEEKTNYMKDKYKITVVGAGATGGFYGGALARSGHEVVFIARGKHLNAIKSDGLHIKSVLLGDFVLDITATEQIGSIGVSDLIIFAVKSWSSKAAINEMASLVGPSTTIISTQNGVDSEKILSDALGIEHIIGCTVTVNSTIETPGTITQKGGPGSIVVGELTGGVSRRVNELVSICKNAGLAAETHDDVTQAIWDKFIFICGLSGMTALTRKPIGDIFSQTTTTKMYLTVLEEVVKVARAEGVNLPENTAAKVLEITKAREPYIIGSMGQDLIAGNRIEIGILNERVVKFGRKHGIPTPANFAITAALKPYELGSASRS